VPSTEAIELWAWRALVAAALAGLVVLINDLGTALHVACITRRRRPR
jgi:hypothetical protein